jgi:Bacterial Ig domain
MGGGPAGAAVGLFPSRVATYLSSVQTLDGADELGVGNVLLTAINNASTIKYAAANGQSKFGDDVDGISFIEDAAEVDESETEADDLVGSITDFALDLDTIVETAELSLALLPFTVISGAVAVYMVAADVAAGVAAIVAGIQGNDAGAEFAHISTTLLGPTDYNSHFAYNLGDLFQGGEGDGGAGSAGTKGSDGADGSVEGGGLDNAGGTVIEDTIIAGNNATSRSLTVSAFGLGQEWNSEGLPTNYPTVDLDTQAQTSTDDLASPGTLTSYNHDLIGIDAGVSGLNVTDLTGTASSPLDPGLTVAARDPGDPTVITAYNPGPIAVNQDSDPTFLTRYDQLGNPRLVGGSEDIGAVERPLAASFVGGSDEDAAENIGTQIYSGWATDISDLSGGTPPTDNLGFVVTDDSDPGLFSTAPSVSPDGTLTFTPAQGQTGVAQITIELEDNAGASNPYTFSITIVPSSPPTLSPIGNIQAMENSSYAYAGAQVGDFNASDPSVRISATSSNTTLIPSFLIFSMSNENGLDGEVDLSMIIAPGQVGTSIITLTVSNSLGSATDSFTVTVLAPVYVPTLDPISPVSVPEDSTGDSVALTGISSGPGDGDPHVNLTVTSNNPSLILDPTIVYDGSSSQGTLVFTPMAGQFGTATISITATNDDSPTSSFTRNFTVTVFHINSAPTIDPVAPITIAEGSDPVFVSLSGITDGAADTGQSITVTATSSNPSLIRNPTHSYVSPDNFGSLTFVPIAGQYGTATITITVQDNGGTAYGGVDTTTESFLVTVTPVQVSVGSVSVQVGSDPDRLGRAPTPPHRAEYRPPVAEPRPVPDQPQRSSDSLGGGRHDHQRHRRQLRAGDDHRIGRELYDHPGKASLCRGPPDDHGRQCRDRDLYPGDRHPAWRRQRRWDRQQPGRRPGPRRLPRDRERPDPAHLP